MAHLAVDRTDLLVANPAMALRVKLMKVNIALLAFSALMA
jgi:hypothetical protein